MVKDVITEYYENPAISQSQLKLLLGNPAVFNTIQEPNLDVLQCVNPISLKTFA